MKCGHHAFVVILPGFVPHYGLCQQYQGAEAPMGLPDRMDKSGHFWTKVDIFGLKLDFSGLAAPIFETPACLHR
jgi:hypothetical protein